MANLLRLLKKRDNIEEEVESMRFDAEYREVDAYHWSKLHEKREKLHKKIKKALIKELEGYG